MTTFLLDLWHDLREKRLWPVAAGLLAAMVAIPLVLLKPASGAPQEPAVVAQSPQRETLPALTVDSSPVHGSKLETFSRRNPFKPLADLKKEEAPSPSSSSKGGGTSPTAGSSAGSPGSSGSGTSPGAPGGSGPGGSTPPGIDPNGPRVQWFRYTADISFGTPDKMKTMKSVKSFTLLPDEKTPAIVFLGVSDDAKSAVFMLSDPAFVADGEGTCNDKKDCRFVKLGLSDGRNEESFMSQDGTVQYDVKLLKITRENISSGEAQGDATDQKSKSRPKKSSGGTTIAETSEDFLPRLLYLPGLARETK